ncbi:MAG TPA: MucBP domain-containing protein [Candidatus Streptococcus faecavium]|uniref:MucBP domain-containing protein n=1 Tax=Candidatus Streptococcus faecavium TaxID=2838763 RepID=A0A9D2FTB6_9STRE|nr:MucBP domain-containing protein [Candidatus Streptococcus faecavium]
MNKQKKYALRKIAGCGLVSCAVGFVLLGGSHVSADENTQPTSNEVTNIVEHNQDSSVDTSENTSTPDMIHTVIEAATDEETDLSEIESTEEASEVSTTESVAPIEGKSEKVAPESENHVTTDEATLAESEKETPERNTDDKESESTSTIRTEDKGKVRSKRTAEVSPEEQPSTQAQPFDLTGWQEISSDSMVTNEFDFNGIHYRMETKMKAPFVANKIINTETGKANTYSFLSGDGGTSRVALYVNDIRYYDKYYYKASSEGINQILGITNTSGIEFSELFTVSKDGAFIHEIRLFNTSDNLQHQKVKINIDTELNGNDRIPIIADGNGGVYITDNDITIWGQPIDDLKAYASTYSAYLTNNPSEGREKGAEMSNNEDTAIVYTSDTFDLQPKEAKTFSWRESLFTDGLNPITMGTVTTNYVDTTGNKLADSKTKLGSKDTNYTTEAVEIPNYTLTTTPSNATGTFGDEPIEVNYVYKKNQGTVTVNYLNEQNEKIADSTTTSGDFDADYHSQGKDIANYTLKTTPTNANGKYGTGNTTVNYVYAKKTGSVTVHYVGEDGNKLADDVVLSGTFDQDYQTQPKDIANYNLKTSPNHATGKYGTTNQELKYVYSKKTAKVTVHYVGEDGSKLADDVVLSGTFDQDYQAQPKEIVNYNLKTSPTNATGKFGASNQEMKYIYSKKTAKVTVHYVGEDGAKLADDVVLSGTFDQDYQAQSKNIENYNLKTSPTHATGKYGTTNQELKYVYSKKTAKVTVHYVGEDGNKLADDVVMSGTFDQDYQTQPKDIANYNLKTTPMNQTGKYGTTNQELKYVYSKKTAKVTVHYVGEDGSKLADDVVMSGTFDQDYKVSAKEIENYNLKASPQKETGKYGVVNQEFSYVYSKKRASIIVRYVDENGKELAKPVTFEGAFDETWEAKPAALTYYFVAKKPATEKGLFGTKNQTIDYVYAKRSAKVTIHFVNQEGEVLAEPVTLSGVFDDSWNSEAKEIENYEIWGVSEEQSGLFGIEDQELTYTYMKKRAQVGIRYVNEAGQDIYPDETLEGNFDETWESHAQEIKNWELVKAPEKESGKYGTEDQMIEYVYKKKRGKVTVQFLDENGKPLADSQVFEGVFDDPYEFSSRAFDGYELVESPKETKGFLETGERTFTFKYKKKATPQPEVKPIAQETPKQPELPKAGSEDVSTITSILGMMLASLGSLLFWKKRKERKVNE